MRGKRLGRSTRVPSESSRAKGNGRTPKRGCNPRGRLIRLCSKRAPAHAPASSTLVGLGNREITHMRKHQAVKDGPRWPPLGSCSFRQGRASSRAKKTVLAGYSETDRLISGWSSTRALVVKRGQPGPSLTGRTPGSFRPAGVRLLLRGGPRRTGDGLPSRNTATAGMLWIPYGRRASGRFRPR